jgi:hypothetical protein
LYCTVRPYISIFLHIFFSFSLLFPSPFTKVDLQDIRPEFLAKARDYIPADRLGRTHCCGLAEFDFLAKV